MTRRQLALEAPVAVAVEAQRAPCGDLRVQLAQAAGGGIARVGEGLLAARRLLGIQTGKAIARHEHLAAGFEQRRRLAAQAQRDGGDGAHVGGHVLAGAAIAARGRLHQQAIAVQHADGQAVELRLRVVVHDRLAGQLAHPAVEIAHLAVVEGIGQRQHGHGVRHLCKRGRRRAADALARRVGRHQRRVLRLQRQQLAHQTVVLGVRDARRVQHVVAVVVLGDFAPQHVDAGARPGLVHAFSFRRSPAPRPRPRPPPPGATRPARTWSRRSAGRPAPWWSCCG